MPKLETCQNEDETHEENQNTIGRRRSLRHSPGNSSLSPPHKTRRIKDASGSSDSKYFKQSHSPTKGSKSSIKISNDEIKHIKDSESNQQMPNEVATRKSTRNSPVALNFSPSRMTRNNSISSNSPSKKNSPNKMTLNESNSSPFRRSTRSKANSPCENENEKNLKDESNVKPRKSRVGHNLAVSENALIQGPSTSISSKRSLPASPEIPIVAKNGKTSPPKRRRICQSLERESPTTNGKTKDDNLSSPKECKIKEFNTKNESKLVTVEATSNTSFNNSYSLSPASKKDQTQTKSPDNISDKQTNHKEKDNIKRRLSNDSSETKENSNKKSRCENDLSLSENLASNLCSEKVKAQNITTINSNSNEISKENIPKHNNSSTSASFEKMDTYSNAELLLLEEFSLTESQCKEICTVLSFNIKGKEIKN